MAQFCVTNTRFSRAARLFPGNRRKFQRYDLWFPVSIRRGGAYGLWEQQGLTMNIGSNGVLLRTFTEVGLGEQLDYVIRLPDDRETGCAVHLRCKGRVIRVKAETGPGGFRDTVYQVATTLTTYEFVRGPVLSEAESDHCVPVN